MVTIGMNYTVLPGKEETFETAFRKVITAMKDMAGHTATRMYRDIDNSRSYVILSEWSDKGAFDAFIGSDTFRNVANWGKENILAGRPSHTYYDH
jgi:heme-degrading monooxygenase HmoA